MWFCGFLTVQSMEGWEEVGNVIILQKGLSLKCRSELLFFPALTVIGPSLE